MAFTFGLGNKASDVTFEIKVLGVFLGTAMYMMAGVFVAHLVDGMKANAFGISTDIVAALFAAAVSAPLFCGFWFGEFFILLGSFFQVPLPSCRPFVMLFAYFIVVLLFCCLYKPLDACLYHPPGPLLPFQYLFLLPTIVNVAQVFGFAKMEEMGGGALAAGNMAVHLAAPASIMKVVCNYTTLLVPLLLLPSHCRPPPPTMKAPTYQHTNLPTYPPTNIPTYQPTNLPTYLPTTLPTHQPTFSLILLQLLNLTLPTHPRRRSWKRGWTA
jgi:hypothetical protein